VRIQRSLPDRAGVVDRDGAAIVFAERGGTVPGFRPALRTNSAAAKSNRTMAAAMITYSGFHRLMVATATARS